MATTEHDVFICSGEPGTRELARSAADALERRGFRVLLDDREPGDAAARPQLAVIAEIPDFVIVLAPGSPSGGAMDPRIREKIDRAIETERNIVRLVAGRLAVDRGAVPDAGFAALSHTQAVVYDAARPRESFALLAHHLSSDGTVDERRTMRRAKRFFWAAGVILLAGIALQEVPRFLERWSRPRLLDPVPPFALYWSAVGQRQEPSGWVAFPVRGTTALQPGDQLRLMFATSADGYAYVVSRNARGQVSILFPTDTVRGASRVKAGEQHVAPVEGEWLSVDGQAPPDVIFIIAGYDAQQNLEELIEEPEALSADAGRRTLLESTVSGLLDGRHGAAERRVWTGKLHPIDPNLKLAEVDRNVPVTLASGRRLEERLAPQPGLVSACVELRFTTRQP